MVFLTICILFFGLALLGLPLVWSLLATCVATIWIFDRSYPLEAIFLTYIDGVQPLYLAAIPMFILAGELISNGGVGRRLIALAGAVFGGVRGHQGIVTVGTCTVFGAISGSAVADSAAVGSIMIPEMARGGYPKPYAAALVATAGTLGILIPPSIPLLVYGFIGQVSVAELFMSGIVPGLIFALCLMILSVFRARALGVDPGLKWGGFAAVSRQFVACLPALTMPAVVLGGIYTGTLTPTESAAIAVLLGLFIGIVVHREITLADLPRFILSSFISSAVIMMVLGATSALAWLLTIEQVPAALSAGISSISDNPIVFLLLMNISLLLIGVFLEPLPALLLTAPLFIPTAAAFGIDPVHLGLVMTFNLAIGLYTPPVGGTLFVSAKIANVDIGQISRELVPMLAVATFVLMLVTYVEAIPMALVWWMRG
jgi:C4-dicarboxylate transporter, DctM subunit